jgi:hypothetical protein
MLKTPAILSMLTGRMTICITMYLYRKQCLIHMGYHGRCLIPMACLGNPRSEIYNVTINNFQEFKRHSLTALMCFFLDPWWMTKQACHPTVNLGGGGRTNMLPQSHQLHYHSDIAVPKCGIPGTQLETRTCGTVLCMTDFDSTPHCVVSTNISLCIYPSMATQTSNSAHTCIAVHDSTPPGFSQVTRGVHFGPRYHSCQPH